jgi:tRNA threonylcarbamoyladenosine modification (KEOPS) complex  Pcc1 subunit
MSEFVQFVPKSELERIKLIREARAIYESVFPSTDAVRARRFRASIGRALGTDRGDDVQS